MPALSRPRRVTNLSQKPLPHGRGEQFPSAARLLIGVLLVAYFIAGLAFLGLRHYLWPRLDDWRPVVVSQLSEALGVAISIDRIETGFEGLLPRLTIHGLRLAGTANAAPGSIAEGSASSPLTVPRAVAVVSPLTLVSGRLRLSVLQFDSPSIRVERLDAQRLRIAGFEVSNTLAGDAAGLAVLLDQRRVLLHDASIEWVDHLRGDRLMLRSVEAGLGTVGRRHRGSLTLGASLPGLGRLQFAFEIYRAAGKPLADWRNWTGTVFTELRALDLGELRTHFAPLARFTGIEEVRGDFLAWAGFESGRLSDAQLRIESNALRWGHEGRTLGLDGLRVDAGARRDLDGFAIRVEQFDAVLRPGLIMSSVGPQEVSLDRTLQPVAGRIGIGRFDPAELLDHLRSLPLPESVSARLAPLSVSGDVSGLSARWSEGSLDTLEASVDFRGLSLAYGKEPSHFNAGKRPSRPGKPVSETGQRGPGDGKGRLPWFERLDGEARIWRDSGELRLRSQGGAFGFPGIFSQPVIELEALAAQARWQLERSQEGQQLAVQIERFEFANADTAGQVTGSYRTGGKGAGIVALTGKLRRVQANRVARYLPLQIDEVVRQWVADSVVGGVADDVRFTLRGDLADFPYRDAGSGEFAIVAQVRGVGLRYAPGWPRIEKIDGTLAFERAGMRIQANSGQVFSSRLSGVRATLADFGKPLLQIEGNGTGPAADMLRFVNESPVATRIDDFTREASASGDAKLALRLQLPLSDLDRSRVAGSVGFDDNELRLDKTLPVFSRVSGILEFSEDRLALRDIRASFLGGSLRVQGQTPEPGRFELQAEGSVSAQGMREVADNPLTRAFGGQTDYRARIDVRRLASEVTIESDLRGLYSSLPPPFRKAAQEAWPLKVTATPELPADPLARPARDTIRLVLRDSIRLLLEREREPGSEKLLIRRGALAMNVEPVLRGEGLAVSLDSDLVDVDAWMPLLRAPELRVGGEKVAEGYVRGDALQPQTVSVRADRLTVAGKDLHNVVLGATRIGEFWSANIDAREVQGFFNWRAALPGQPIGTLTARFNKLEIPRTRVREFENLLDTAPTDLPALDILADNFVLFEHPLGQLELKATNSVNPARPGWRLDTLRIRNPAASFNATGSWAPAAVAGVRPTRLTFDLQLADSGGTLGLFDLKDVMRGAAGKISGQVHWQGSPMAIDYASLGGSLKLAIGKGQFLKSDPGIAKLIGVLSLQSLPRRLTLDFRDVFAQGYAFDEVNGDVAIEHGVARSENLLMKGVQAQVRISGSADIARETQQLRVEVTPEINAGLASLAYGAMVNPAIGLGTFAAQLALRGPIQQLLRYEYDVRGSWADPQVVERRRSINSLQQIMP